MEYHSFKYTATRNEEIIHAGYKLHGQILERVSSTGYLGLIINANGQWNEHIDTIAIKGNKLLAFLRRRRSLLE